MVVTQQPWVFLLKMIIFGARFEGKNHHSRKHPYYTSTHIFHAHTQLMWHSDATPLGWCRRCFCFAKNHGFFRGFPRLLRYWILHCIRVQLRAVWFPCLRKKPVVGVLIRSQARFDPLEFWEVVFLRKHVDVFIVQPAIVLYSEHGRCSNNLHTESPREKSCHWGPEINILTVISHESSKGFPFSLLRRNIFLMPINHPISGSQTSFKHLFCLVTLNNFDIGPVIPSFTASELK